MLKKTTRLLIEFSISAVLSAFIYFWNKSKSFCSSICSFESKFSRFWMLASGIIFKFLFMQKFSNSILYAFSWRRYAFCIIILRFLFTRFIALFELESKVWSRSTTPKKFKKITGLLPKLSSYSCVFLNFAISNSFNCLDLASEILYIPLQIAFFFR